MKVDTVLGPFIVPEDSDAVVTSLKILGEWAQEEITLLCKFLAPGDVVYDIGAFIGTHTRAFSHAVGTGGKVIGFEASPGNFEFYLANRDLALLENIELINKAVGDHVGEVDIGSLTPDHAGTKSLQASVEGGGEHVEMTTLDAAGFPAPSLIKIDVEGAELQVLRGASDMLKANRPVIFAETNRVEGSAEVAKLARENGYAIYGTIHRAFREENFNNHPVDIFCGGVECGLLLVPTEKVDQHADVLAPLARMESDDDLVLLLLNKPQFTTEVLLHLASADTLGVPMIDVGPVRMKDQFEQLQTSHNSLIDNYAELEADLWRIRDQRDQLEAQRQELADTLRDKEQELADTLRDKEQELADTLRDKEQELADTLRNKEQELADALRDKEQELENLKRQKADVATVAFWAADKAAQSERRAPLTLLKRLAYKIIRLVWVLPGVRSTKFGSKLQKVLHRNSPNRFRRRVRDVLLAARLNSNSEICQEDYALVNENFDPVFYRARYGRLLDEECDLVTHYMTEGWRKSFDPTSKFSTQFYLNSNPQVAENEVVPFLHYLREGRNAGRLGRHPAGFRGEALADLRPYKDGAVRFEVTDVKDRLQSGLLEALATDGGTRLVVSLSHDDFTTVVGGTQLCIQREEVVAKSQAIHYLNLNPKKLRWGLAPEADGANVEISSVLDGRKTGLCNYDEIIRELRAYTAAGGEVRLVVHHLMGHAPEKVVEMARAAGQSEVWVWLHDFFTLCPGYNLLRNGVSFCNAPPVGSPGCSICVFGRNRGEHIERVGTIFKAMSVHTIAPSQVTADLWTSKGLHPVASVVIVPHVTLETKPRSEVLPVVEDGPIRIGFLGAPVTHKGWESFARLFTELKGHTEFEFVYLGNSAITETMECRHVEVSNEAPYAMIEAVREAELDLVVHFALWPETFSFTTFEALAGGAGVLTNPGSGNVAAKVNETGLGAILDGYIELRTFLTSGDAARLVSELRERRAREMVIYRMSDMTIPYLGGDFSQ